LEKRRDPYRAIECSRDADDYAKTSSKLEKLKMVQNQAVLDDNILDEKGYAIG
jgi:hypothetical protein